jgi:NitT/TauT family transport system substrate-binding protein
MRILPPLRAAALAATAIASIIGLTRPAAAADDVSFAMDWIINGAHAGYFAGIEKGYYRDEGLNVTISRGFGSGDTVKRLAAGRADFGVADTSALITALANDGVPVRAVAMVYDKASLGIIYIKESGIKTPKDLEGRAIARSAAGASVNMFPGFLAVNNIDRSKIKEVVVDGANFLPLMMSRQVDGVLEQSINIGRFRRQAQAQKLTVEPMRYSDFGLLTYGNAIMTSETTARTKVDLVKRMNRATFKALEYAFAHPDEAVAIMRKQNPEVDAEIGKEELLAIRDLALTDHARKQGLGVIDAAQMTQTRDIVVKALTLKREVPINEIYVDGLVTKK